MGRSQVCRSRSWSTSEAWAKGDRNRLTTESGSTAPHLRREGPTHIRMAIGRPAGVAGRPTASRRALLQKEAPQGAGSENARTVMPERTERPKELAHSRCRYPESSFYGAGASARSYTGLVWPLDRFWLPAYATTARASKATRPASVHQATM